MVFMCTKAKAPAFVHMEFKLAPFTLSCTRLKKATAELMCILFFVLANPTLLGKYTMNLSKFNLHCSVLPLRQVIGLLNPPFEKG